jgi:hypothetical protein
MSLGLGVEHAGGDTTICCGSMVTRLQGVDEAFAEKIPLHRGGFAVPNTKQNGEESTEAHWGLVTLVAIRCTANSHHVSLF